ncbi:MAG: hypothetical protein ABGW97_02835 [Christiangramia sp.]|uniref:hypothetical protein n=1 Tax=Christiangramia sp. TaxID=1931228 RepID=UPI003241C6A3
MSIGAFASNDEARTEFSTMEIETIETSIETSDAETADAALRAEIIVNCEDGSSYTVSCDSCSTSQLIGIAMALCA